MVLGVTVRMKALVIGGAMHDVYIVPEKALVQRLVGSDSEYNYSLMVSDEKIAARKIVSHAGGGAVNVSTALRKMGVDVVTFCKVGRDWPGDGIVHFLQEQGINVSNIRFSDNFPTGISYVIMCPGSGHIIISSKLANTDIAADEIPVTEIGNSDFVYISSLEKKSISVLKTAISVAKQRGVKVCLNPGGSMLTQNSRLIEEIAGYCDIFILNFVEANSLAKSIPSLRSSFVGDNFNVQSFLRAMLKLGVGIIVVTNGSQGVYLASKGKGVFHPGIKVEYVDTVGAGDAFGSVFSYCIFSGRSVEKSMKMAMLSSCSVIKKIGANEGLLGLTNLESALCDIPTGLTRYFDVGYGKDN